MSGCLIKTIRQLSQFDLDQIAITLSNETHRLELTKSLLSILYNICIDHSIKLSPAHKKQFAAFEPIVIKLLAGASAYPNKTNRLLEKKRILGQNPELVRLISQACPSKLDK